PDGLRAAVVPPVVAEDGFKLGDRPADGPTPRIRDELGLGEDAAAQHTARFQARLAGQAQAAWIDGPPPSHLANPHAAPRRGPRERRLGRGAMGGAGPLSDCRSTRSLRPRSRAPSYAANSLPT